MCVADDVFAKASEALKSPSEEARREAVLTLFKLKDRRAIDLFAKICEMDRSSEVRTQARKAYYLLRDVHPNNLSEPFLELPDGISFDDLEKLLVDENPRIRGEAIKLCGKLDPVSTAPPLRQAIAAEKNARLQADILRGLGRAGLKYDIPTIADFLYKGDSNLQIAAIESLAMIGGADALEYVVPFLRDPDSTVRAAATKALPPLEGGEMLNILRGMAVSTNQSWRESVIHQIQRFKVPLASKILAHLAAVDPVIALRERAKAALEAMARTDENARKELAELNTPEEPDDPNAPATVPLDGIWETTPETTLPVPPDSTASTAAQAAASGTTPPTTGQAAEATEKKEATPPRKPRVLVVPGVSKKLVKAICLGDQAQRQDGLRQFGALLKPEHLPFLLLQLDREKDPRIVSHLLSLIGRLKNPQAYAAVVKRFKDVDNRVRANAIEAAMQIDPITTPDRLAGFLNDPNNRIRANTIIASANKHGFDALVWLRDLAAFGDPAYRRSALYVIDKLKLPSFLEVLEILICDDDLEVRHMAHKAIHEYAAAGDKKAKSLIELADRMMARTNMGEGDFHAAMVQMRAPTAQKKAVKKASKSASEELGEQLLGTDGLKAAGQSIKNLQDQAKAAREKMAAKLSQTTASITSADSREKITGVALAALAVLALPAHAANAFRLYLAESPQHLLALIMATIAWVVAVPLLIKRSFGTAAAIGMLLLTLPWLADRFDLQDADLFGGSRVQKRAAGAPPSGSTASHTEHVGVKRPTTRVASATRPVHTASATTEKPAAPVDQQASNVQAAAKVKLLVPQKGDLLIGSFTVRASVSGKPKSVEFLLDDKVVKKVPEAREGPIEFVMNTDAYDIGGHLLRARVVDSAGRRGEEQLFVKFLTPMTQVAIKAPANGSVLWKDGHLLVDVIGNEYDQVEFVLNDQVICTFPYDQANLYDYPLPIATLTEGTHRFEANVRMTDGRIASSGVTFKALNPKPTIGFETPQNGQDVYGTVDVVFKADSGWRDTKIHRVTWSVDGLEKKTMIAEPWQDIWEAGDMEPGPHVLKAVIENELERTAEATIRVNVIQPKLSASIKGLRNGQILTEDHEVTIEVISDGPGTTIEEIAVCVDNKLLKSLTSAPYKIVLKVKEFGPGPHKLTAEVSRSDGRKFKTSPVSFSTNPRDRRTIYFMARKANGQSLGADDISKMRIELKEDGVAVAGPSFQPADSGPLQLGLMIGTPASLKTEKRLSRIKQGASVVVDRMKAQDQMFLMKFSDTAELVKPATSDRTALLQEIEYLAPQRGTALYDAVARAVEESSKWSGMTALILFSDRGDVNVDGRGPVSKRTREEVLELVRRSNVQIYAVSLGNPDDSAFPAADEALQSLAQASHGRYYNAAVESDLSGVFESVMKDVKAQVRMTYTSPSGIPDGKWHTIEIQTAGTSDVKLHYKPGYIAR